jgi:integrase
LPLTTPRVAELLRSGTPRKVADGNSLYLIVRRKGVGYWVGQYRDYANRGRFQTKGLGRAPRTSLKAARDAWKYFQATRPKHANLQTGEVAGSALARTPAKAIPMPIGKTYADLLQEYVEVKADEWRGGATGKYGRLYAADANITLPDGRTLSTLRAPEITDDLLAAVAGTFDNPRKAKETTARIRAVRDGAKPKAPKATPHPSLDWKQVPTFYANLDMSDILARALAFTILTGVRISDVVGEFEHGRMVKPPATWSEVFELDGMDVWRIPDRRAKNGNEHTVPLGATARALLGERGADHAPLFSVEGSAYDKIERLVRRFNKAPATKFTIHGFRSSFDTWMTDMDFKQEHRELAMQHIYRGRVERSYNRSEVLPQRREIMAAWAKHCTAS